MTKLIRLREHEFTSSLKTHLTMTIMPVKQAQYSFEDYLHHNTDSEHRYELVDGELTLMNPPTVRHFLIAKYLEACFDREIQNQSLPWLCLREAGVRTGWQKSRLADLLIMDREQVKQKLDQTAIFQVPPVALCGNRKS